MFPDHRPVLEAPQKRIIPRTRLSLHTERITASYFFTDVFDINSRKCSISCISPSVSSASAATAFFERLSISTPFSVSHALSCATEFGFSRPVNVYACSVATAVCMELSFTACRANSKSTNTPRSFILWSSTYNRCSDSLMGYISSFFAICLSTSTSLLQYSLNSAHFSGASPGIFLVLPPFDLVGLQETQKYLINSLPSVIFCRSKPRAAPTSASDDGSDSSAACTAVQYQDEGSSRMPRCFDRHTRSN